jgi:outer membrane protein assembly factor BamA
MRRLLFIMMIILFFAKSLPAIEITGNHLYTDKDLIHLVKVNGNSDTLINQIKSLYQNQGYFNAKVTIDSTKSGIKQIDISEGRISKIQNLSIELIPPNTPVLIGDLITDLQGHTATGNGLNDLAQQCVARLAENGMPFATAHWNDFEFDGNGDISANLQVLTGLHTRITEIRYRGLKRTKAETLNRAMDFRLGDYFCESKIKLSEHLLDQMPYLRIAAPFEIEPLGDGDSCRVIFNTAELPSTRFDGVGGVSSIKGKSAVVGRLDLEFGDILGTGRAFGLFWNKKDRYSSELRLNYLEPYVLGSRIDFKLEAHQIDRDSLFIESGASLGLLHEFGTGLGGSLTLTFGRTVPEAGSIVTGSTSRAVGVQFSYDAIDRHDNPTAGYTIMTSVNYKYRSNSSVVQNVDTLTLPTRQTSAGIDLHYYARVTRRFVAAFGLSIWGIVSSDGQTPPDELRYLGGFESLRGYGERQIPAYRYAIATLEPRLITGRESRAYLFFDLADIKGAQSDGYRILPGYGLGLAAPTTLGQFKLEIGWGKTGFPSDAILNFSLAGQF